MKEAQGLIKTSWEFISGYTHVCISSDRVRGQEGGQERGRRQCESVPRLRAWEQKVQLIFCSYSKLIQLRPSEHVKLRSWRSSPCQKYVTFTNTRTLQKRCLKVVVWVSRVRNRGGSGSGSKHLACWDFIWVYNFLEVTRLQLSSFQ